MADSIVGDGSSEAGLRYVPGVGLEVRRPYLDYKSSVVWCWLVALGGVFVRTLFFFCSPCEKIGVALAAFTTLVLEPSLTMQAGQSSKQQP